MEENQVQIYREYEGNLAGSLFLLSFGLLLLVLFLSIIIAMLGRLALIWHVVLISCALGIALPVVAAAIYRLRKIAYMDNLRKQHAREELEAVKDARRRVNEQHELSKDLAATRVAADPLGNYPHLLMPPDRMHQVLSFAPGNSARGVGRVTKVEEVPGLPAPDADSAIPTLVRYEDIRAQVPRGHTLLGVSERGVETREFAILSTCWIVGGSKTGKTTTVSLKVDEAYRQGCFFCVVDPHRYKEDSLYNAIKGYSDHFLAPGVAVTPEETLAVLKAFLREAQARLDGRSPDRAPIILLADEVGHICDSIGLEGEELALAQEITGLMKKISRMCGQELRGYKMYGWFISQTATGLAWLRKNAMTVIAHKVLMMSERKLACNEDATVARSMDTWPIGRVMIYGLDFPDGYLITQMAQFTARVVEADPMPALPVREQRAFRPGEVDPKRAVSANETPADAPSNVISMPFRASVTEQPASVKRNPGEVSDETKKAIVKMNNDGIPLRKIATYVGLAGEKYGIFKAVCIELGIKKAEEA